ncbi:hypothetical protein [Streptomyces chattanoogensis]|uniref:hypothetical protein n=1 Tax=Streptomyces chattanoogensis TaxID=66876 RepID=UPI0005D99F40|nr:hypothetical protein T261_1546 [Streptomyces lydicus]
MVVEEAMWTWERALPLKYVLVSEEWDGELIVWARCAEADGLFVESAPRRERLTFVGCAPTGRLLKAAERARHRSGEPVDLGALGLIVDFPVPGADPEGDPYDTYDDHHWELLTPVLVDCRPSGVDASLLDLVVEAEVDGPVWRREPADAEWRLFNGGGGGSLGECRRVEGLYGNRPFPESPPMRLIGCEPGERLLRRLVRPRGDGDRVTLLAVDRTGRVMRHQEDMPLRVVASRPSALGGALVDLWLAEGPAVRPVPAARPVWDAWFEGPPTEPGAWAAFPSEGRAEWAAFAAARQDAGRPLPNPVRHLDGRHVTDVQGLMCAIGEAVAGPGGLYPQCWHTLRGCPCGGDFPPAPFTLVWHDAEVARRALAAVTVDTAGETPYVDDVLRLLARVGITVELR